MRDLQNFLDATQRRAFDLFQERGAAPGGDLEDWLRAEREVVWSPPAELSEDDKEFRVEVATPGLEPNQIRITALPETIVVKGEATRKNEGTERAVHFSEFSRRELLRRFSLPSRIDVDRVSATLDNGILRIVAPKTKAAPGRQVPVNRS
jgi:HSP20 family protein